jgi:hypothetical protein
VTGVDLEALVRDDGLDAELGGLLEVIVGRGLPLVVAGGSTSARDRLLEALGRGDPAMLVDPADPDPRSTARSFLHQAGEGLPVSAIASSASLEELFETLTSPAIGLSRDDLTALGLVLIVGAEDRVDAVHWVRPLARDGHGHVQRLGPAVLAARDPRTGRLEHYAWGVLPELAIRLETTPAELDAAAGERARTLRAEAIGRGGRD